MGISSTQNLEISFENENLRIIWMAPDKITKFTTEDGVYEVIYTRLPQLFWRACLIFGFARWYGTQTLIVQVSIGENSVTLNFYKGRKHLVDPSIFATSALIGFNWKIILLHSILMCFPGAICIRHGTMCTFIVGNMLQASLLSIVLNATMS